MMASCRSMCQTTCVPVKGEENMAIERNCLDKDQDEVMVIRKNTNSEVLLHNRLPVKGQENVVLEKSSLNKEPEEMMLMRKNNI